jgi:DNA polymerase-2
LKLNGWILDLYPCPQGMVVWLIEPSQQKRRRLIDSSFRPCFYVQGPEKQLARLAEALTARAAVTCALTERQNIWDRRMLRVLQVAAHHPTLFAPLTRFVRRFDSSLALYDSDLMLAAMYCWEKNVFPLARVEIEAGLAGTDVIGASSAGPGPNAVRPYSTPAIHSITCRDDEWLTEYERPPVRTMRLRLEGITDVNPKHGRHGSIEVAVENDWQVLDDSDEPTAQVIEGLLRKHDPDVLVTEWGDDVLLPGLLQQAQRLHIRLPLNRDALPVERTRSRSYMSYGRILFKESTTTLFGRLHIDTQNSFATGTGEAEKSGGLGAGGWGLGKNPSAESPVPSTQSPAPRPRHGRPVGAGAGHKTTGAIRLPHHARHGNLLHADGNGLARRGVDSRAKGRAGRPEAPRRVAAGRSRRIGFSSASGLL